MCNLPCEYRARNYATLEIFLLGIKDKDLMQHTTNYLDGLILCQFTILWQTRYDIHSRKKGYGDPSINIWRWSLTPKTHNSLRRDGIKLVLSNIYFQVKIILLPWNFKGQREVKKCKASCVWNLYSGLKVDYWKEVWKLSSVELI